MNRRLRGEEKKEKEKKEKQEKDKHEKKAKRDAAKQEKEKKRKDKGSRRSTKLKEPKAKKHLNFEEEDRLKMASSADIQMTEVVANENAHPDENVNVKKAPTETQQPEKAQPQAQSQPQIAESPAAQASPKVVGVVSEAIGDVVEKVEVNNTECHPQQPSKWVPSKTGDEAAVSLASSVVGIGGTAVAMSVGGEPIQTSVSDVGPRKTTSPVRPNANVNRTANLDVNEIKREKARNVVRKRVVDELLTTEANYVKGLEVVVKQVVSPLKQTTLRVLNEEELDVIFLNIEEILTLQQNFLDLLQKRVATWSTKATIGDVILDNCDFLIKYKKYLTNYNTSLVALRHLVKRKPDFAQIKQSFEVQQQKTTALTLDSFLIMPVQRIPRYVLLLKELLKYTNPSHPDFPLLEQAYAKVKKILDELNRGIDQETHTRVQKIISIEDDIDGVEEYLPSGLYAPHRFLVREGLLKLRVSPLVKSKRETSIRAFQKQYYVFMFNDMLVCCGRRDDPSKREHSAVAGAAGMDSKRTSISSGGSATSSPSVARRGTVNAQQQPGAGGEAGAGGGMKSFMFACSLFFKELEAVGDGPQPEEVEASPTKLMHVQHAFHLMTTKQGWTVIASTEEEKNNWLHDVKSYSDLVRQKS
jgi:hypothetical protein